MQQTIPNGHDSQNNAIFQLKDASPMENARMIIHNALENPNVVWYVQIVDGQRFGPTPTPVIKEWIGQKRISPTMLVWCEGMPEWLPAANVFPELLPTIRQSKPTQPVSAPESDETDEDDDYPDIEQNRIRLVDDKKTKFIIIAVMIVVLAALALLLLPRT